jgi:hypothetical protein
MFYNYSIQSVVHELLLVKTLWLNLHYQNNEILCNHILGQRRKTLSHQVGLIYNAHVDSTETLSVQEKLSYKHTKATNCTGLISLLPQVKYYRETALSTGKVVETKCFGH